MIRKATEADIPAILWRNVQVMVMHTLTVDPAMNGRGAGVHSLTAPSFGDILYGLTAYRNSKYNYTSFPYGICLRYLIYRC